MTRIRTTCPSCGEVEMGPDEITLIVSEGGGESRYHFRCPMCFDDVEKRADRTIVALLISAGVIPSSAEGDAAGGRRNDGAAPISHDELLDFHAAMERKTDDEIWEELERG